MPVSTIQLDGFGKLLLMPMKSSLHVREKPGIAGGAARVKTSPVEITAMAFENMMEAESGRVTVIRRPTRRISDVLKRMQ